MTGFDASPLEVRAAAFALACVFVAASLAIFDAGGRRKTRVAALAVALAAGFAIVARPRLLPGGSSLGQLVTPGGGSRLTPAADGPRFLAPDVEPWRPGAADAAREIPPLGRWSDLGQAPGWQLRGAGLSSEEWRGVPPGVALEPDASFTARGLVDVRWPRRVTLGDPVTVAGRYRPEGSAVVLRLSGPGGVEAESAPLDDASPEFRLSMVPRAVGRLLLDLEERSSEGTPLRRHTLDVVVAPPTYPRVRIVAERASADASALRRWLAARGAEVELRVALGGGTVASSPPLRLADRALEAAESEDLLVTFAAATSGNGGGEAATAAVSLRTARGADLVPLALAAPPDDPKPASAATPVRDPLVTSTQGAAFAWSTEDAARAAPAAPIRIERVGAPDLRVESLVVGSYRFLLRGDEASYAELWSTLLEAVRAPRPSPRCEMAGGPVREDRPVALVCRADRPPRLILVGGETAPSEEIATAAHPLDAGRFDAVVWPRGEGWRRLMASDRGRVADVEFYVQPRDSWSAWDLERRVRATDAHRAEAAAAGDLPGGRVPPPARRAIPTAACWAVLVGALAVLWGVERSGG
jgi:hypothetical protein